MVLRKISLSVLALGLVTHAHGVFRPEGDQSSRTNARPHAPSDAHPDARVNAAENPQITAAMKAAWAGRMDKITYSRKGFAQALEALPFSTRLSIRGVTTENIDRVLRALGKRMDITVLNFRDNRLGDAGAAKLAEFAKTAPNLTALNVRDNQLTDQGIRALMEALQESQTLESINVKPTSEEDSNLRDTSNKVSPKLRKELEDMNKGSSKKMIH